MNVTSTSKSKKNNKSFLSKRSKIKPIKLTNPDQNSFNKETNIWIKMLGEVKYNQLREMNNSDLFIIKWQKQRVIKTTFLLPIIYALYIISSDWKFLVGGSIAMLVFYFMEAKNITNSYVQYKFERHLEFSKFTRLLVPYLKKQEDNNNMWSIFNKLIDRLKYETDKKLLMSLMNDMVDRPHDIEPFETFARKMSNTDNSHLFMGTVFDIREGTADLAVIEELDRLASEELMDGINSIIEYKSKRFDMFPTKITMSLMIPMIGYFAGFILSTLKDLSFISF